MLVDVGDKTRVSTLGEGGVITLCLGQVTGSDLICHRVVLIVTEPCSVSSRFLCVQKM